MLLLLVLVPELYRKHGCEQLSGMQGVEDTLGGIETWYYIEVLRGGDPAKVQTPAEARAALQAVTKDDVRAILRKLTLSVSYLLTKEVAAHAAE